MKKIAVMAVLALVVASPALAGDTLWTRTYAGAGATVDRGSAVATIGDEIYVAGQERVGSFNLLVIHYRADGEVAWARTFDIDTEETVNDIVAQPDSSLYICVKIEAPTPSSRLVKLSKTGDTVWTRKSARLNATNIAVDDSGNVFVYGSLLGAVMNDSFCLIKYKADGTQDWRHTYRFGDQNSAAGLCADHDGSVVGVGVVNDQEGPHAMAVRFTPAGDTAWTHYYPELTGATLGGVAVDLTGFIVFTASIGSGITVARCSTSGPIDWRVEVPLRSLPMVYNTVVCDADTNIVVGGQDSSNCVGFAKLTWGGGAVCMGSSDVVAMPYGLAVDASKRPIVVGQRNLPPPPCCFTVKFTGVPGVAESVAPTPAGAAVRVGARLVRPGTALSVEVSVPGRYSLALFDARGALVRRLHDGQLAAGVHRFNPGRLAAGSYCLMIAGKTGASEVKIIQVR